MSSAGTVRAVDVFRRNIHPVGEFAADDLAVGLVVAHGQANILIQGKAADLLKVQAVLVVAACQLVVDRQR